MPSGRKQIVFNTLERAISPDVNRLQSFAGKDDAELWRYMLDVTVNDDLDAGGVVAENLSLENPLRAEIINGILVRPQPASLNLLVDPGVLYAVSPDADADASAYKYVHDAGVLALGSLVITPGAGATRIDVVECQINPIPLTATDNRDLFNPVTGLFTPTVVTKETQGRLTYRVRAGVAGGGFPGTALGWLPLCVVSVPAAAASVDVMTFWDVRPIVSDRAFQPFANSVARPVHRSSMANGFTVAATTGLSEVIFGRRRLGGRLRSGSVVADADNVDFSIAANQEPGFALVASRPWYVYFLSPFGLPRWARYNASGTRVPRSPRGIPVASMTAADSDGNPSAAISLPTATGLGGSTTAGVAIYAGYVTSTGVQGGFYGDNTEGYFLTGDFKTLSPMEVAATSTSGSTTTNLFATFTLTSGVNFPAHARSLLVEPRFRFVAGAGQTFDDTQLFLNTFAQNGGPRLSRHRAYGLPRVTVGGGDQNKFTTAMWVPVPTVYPSVAAFTMVVELNLENSVAMTGAFSDAFVRVLGWKF